ncbi:MAG: hypothetical protein U1E87_05655 [Alphaproteobacteria bacterium]
MALAAGIDRVNAASRRSPKRRIAMMRAVIAPTIANDARMTGKASAGSFATPAFAEEMTRRPVEGTGPHRRPSRY